MVLRIVRIENLPRVRSSCDIVVICLQILQTDVHETSKRWMEEELGLSSVDSSSKHDLPLLELEKTELESAAQLGFDA